MTAEGELLFFDWFDDLSVADRVLVLEYLTTHGEELVRMLTEEKSGTSPATAYAATATKQSG